MAGILYIVPTPVGNLEDMTFRAIRVLKEADLILAEDTRTSSVLLKHYDIKGRLESHHKFNEHKTVSMIKERILAGLNVALISDAGTPGISDRGLSFSMNPLTGLCVLLSSSRSFSVPAAAVLSQGRFPKSSRSTEEVHWRMWHHGIVSMSRKEKS